MEPVVLVAFSLAVLAICALVVLLTVREPRKAFFLVIFCTPFVLTPLKNPVLMRIGLPELVFCLFFFAWCWHVTVARRGVRKLNLVHHLIFLFFAAVCLSMINITRQTARSSVVELVILGYLIVFCLIANQVMASEDDVRSALDAWMLGAAVVGAIGLYEVFAVVSGAPRLFPYKDPYRVMATFRRPPQLGVYALATYFVAIAYSFMGGHSRNKRLALWALAATMVILIGFSSRRSVTAALVVGTFMIVITKASRPGWAILLGLAFAGVGFGVHELIRHDPELYEFFGRRLGLLVTERAVKNAFIRANFRDAIAAFFEHPWLGIGYGAFWMSDYSTMGNEIHSTPLRILAGCGVLGMLAYLAMTVGFIVLAYRNLRLSRGTRWAGFASTLLPALFALQLSYAYNRCVRDRTYWLIIALVVALNQVLVEGAAKKQIPVSDGAEEAQALEPSADFSGGAAPGPSEGAQ